MRANGGGGSGKRNGGAGATTTPRRRRRSNRGALIGVSAIGLALLLGLIAVVWLMIDDDDDGGDGNGNAAGAVATQTREAELAALAALTPTAVPSPTTAPEPDPTEEAAENPSNDEAAQEGGNGGGDADAAADAPTNDDEEEPTEEEDVTLESFLPSSRDVPDGFSLVDAVSGEFTEAEVVENLGNEEESAALLDEWGWREGAVRQYNMDGEPAAEDTSVLIGSAHRFSSSSAANEALTYFSDAVAGPQDLEDIEVDRIGDETRALSGQTAAGANQVILYIRTGPYLLRIAGASAEGDPTDAVIALAEQLVDG